MGRDGDEMGQAAEEGIIALYGTDTFLPFFSPADKLDRDRDPSPPSVRLHDPGYTSLSQ